MFMSANAAAKALSCMEHFLAHYAWLHNYAKSQDLLLYNWVPKAHYAWHLAYCCRHMNARFTWTYKCESWVGQVAHIAASCAHGTSKAHLSGPLAEKYRLLVHFRLDRMIHDED